MHARSLPRDQQRPIVGGWWVSPNRGPKSWIAPCPGSLPPQSWLSRIADLIRRDTAAIDTALSNLARWEKTLQGWWIEEWRALLLGPRDPLLALLTERSESTDRLRQSNPFPGVRSQAESQRIYA